MNFHHIGIACSNIADMKLYLERFCTIKEISSEVFDERQEANVCMVVLEDGTKVELISGSRVEKMVKKRQFLYHTCYVLNEEEDINKKIKEFEEAGAKLISEPKQAKLFKGKQVAFLMTKMGLIELLECEEGAL